MRFIKLILLFLSLVFSVSSFAQNKKGELQKQKAKLQKEINYVNSLLAENKKASKFSVAQVRNIATKIGIRHDLINNINREI